MCVYTQNISIVYDMCVFSYVLRSMFTGYTDIHVFVV